MDQTAAREAVSRRVKQALAEQGVTGVELARRMSVTQSYVARRLAGRVPWTTADLVLVGRAIDVPVVELLPEACEVSA
jgi:transcriptional regulator with XRE-family HTH domain